uniref:phosphoribosylamine--glycine ligase n=1 Tax=Mantoniella antarctica TaxID=81844 RepID=A0A7S0X3A7_9CHLO|mmetsp:Transcript_13285/g.32291  ORF Transcript_13285/g.32291 Transcript_13285/m.32291 type:complete len:509 (+) Transcript_13285:132-1658(+)
MSRSVAQCAAHSGSELSLCSSRARLQEKRAAAAPLRWHSRATARPRMLVMVYAGVGGGSPVVAAADLDKINVLVVGGGGREHSLCWRLRLSPTCGDLFCCPGNAGIVVEEGVQTVDVNEKDHAAVVAFCEKNAVGLVVCGPEAPLVDGLADSLNAAGVPCFGPSASAARLEGSKGFLKDLLAKYDIPTAKYARFTDPAAAKAYITTQGAPIVVKTDGLAAGKGVIVAMDVHTALDAVDDMMVRSAFGDAGSAIVVEEFLTGEEASFFAVVGGGMAVPLVGAQDHKRVGEGDTGLNTGGMGAYSPAPVLTPELEAVVMRDIIQPTVDGMAAEGCPFTGVLFAGLMIEDGQVKLLEHNVRFGDPECQCLMVRMKSDLVQLLLKAATGALDTLEPLEWTPEVAVVVVMAAAGYPGAYVSGEVIAGLPAADAQNGVKVFHAGTAVDAAGNAVSAGGRVLGVTATGADITQAAARAYRGVDAVAWPGGFVRRDIGWRAIAREKAQDKVQAVGE